MAIQRGTTYLRDFSGGLQEFVSPFLTKPGEALMPSKNFDVSDPGKIKRGPGFSALGSAEASICKGMFVFNKEDGTHELLKLHTTTLKSWDGAAWNSESTGFTNNSTDIAYGVTTYSDSAERLYIVTGHNDLLTYYNGSAVATVANTYAKHIEFYKGRIYIANIKLTSTVYPTRVQFSGIGTDDFDTLNDYFDDMGQPVTGLKVMGDYLYIFTEDKAARWDGAILTPLQSTYGTPHGRSIATTNGMLFWYNRTGIHMTNGIGSAQLISRAVTPLIEAISSSTHVSAATDNRGRVYFWIGDITYKGVSYTDVVLRYDTNINSWDVQDGLPMNVLISRIDSGVLKLYGADTTVGVIDDTDSRLGSGFEFQYTTTWFFTQDHWRNKNYYQAYITTSKVDSGDSQEITLKYQVNVDTSFTTLGTTFTTSESEQISHHTIPLKNSTGQAPRGKMVRFQISKTASKPFELNELRLQYGTEARPD